MGASVGVWVELISPCSSVFPHCSQISSYLILASYLTYLLAKSCPRALTQQNFHYIASARHLSGETLCINPGVAAQGHGAKHIRFAMQMWIRHIDNDPGMDMNIK